MLRSSIFASLALFLLNDLVVSRGASLCLPIFSSLNMAVAGLMMSMALNGSFTSSTTDGLSLRAVSGLSVTGGFESSSLSTGAAVSFKIAGGGELSGTVVLLAATFTGRLLLPKPFVVLLSSIFGETFSFSFPSGTQWILLLPRFWVPRPHIEQEFLVHMNLYSLGV